MKILMAVIGIILLLPGACALFFMVAFQFDSSLMGLWGVCFVISAGGVALLVGAFRGGQTSGPAGP